MESTQGRNLRLFSTEINKVNDGLLDIYTAGWIDVLSYTVYACSSHLIPSPNIPGPSVVSHDSAIESSVKLNDAYSSLGIRYPSGGIEIVRGPLPGVSEIVVLPRVTVRGGSVCVRLRGKAMKPLEKGLDSLLKVPLYAWRILNSWSL